MRQTGAGIYLYKKETKTSTCVSPNRSTNHLVNSNNLGHGRKKLDRMVVRQGEWNNLGNVLDAFYDRK